MAQVGVGAFDHESLALASSHLMGISARVHQVSIRLTAIRKVELGPRTSVQHGLGLLPGEEGADTQREQTASNSIDDGG
jgi:hypothetical protein